MRLINAQTLTLEEHTDPIPPYAILSHTWGQQELTFQRFQALSGQEREAVKSGPSKIGQVCRLTRQHGHGYVWVDTCCIDKSSSADLNEAVNSMYRYYQEAQVCYVYLADATRKGRGSLRHCRWFRRGWTLQELIAPQRVAFYDQAWEYCGDKTDKDLLRLISSITSIDESVLENLESVTSFPVSKRMSWAADRSCLRQEDMAYSLMGIFDINMPVLYGEGPHAFHRLQQHISQRNLDLSLLAWTSNNGEETHRGLLAHSPSEFRIFQKVTLIKGTIEGQSEVTVANGCLRVTGGKVFTRTSGTSTACILDLGWIGKGASFFWRVGILLRKAVGTFFRAFPQKLFVVRLEDVRYTRTLSMRMDMTLADLQSLQRFSMDLASSYQARPRAAGCPAPPSQLEYEWGSYPSHGCRAKQIETMYDHGLCLDMRCSQNDQMLRALEPWALRPTLFWKVWPGGGSNTTAVKVFLRHYDTPLLRGHVSTAIQQGKERPTGWLDLPHENPVPKAAMNDNMQHPGTASLTSSNTLTATIEPPRKRRRDETSSAATSPPRSDDTPMSYSALFPSRSLACPFYMNDKLQCLSCKDSFLRTIQDVGRHLLTHHVRVSQAQAQAPYCPVCGIIFNRIGERDAHIVGGACSGNRKHQTPAAAPNITTSAISTTPKGPTHATEHITEEQCHRILNIINTSTDFEDFQVWYLLWDELFPGERYPPSVWRGSETEETSEITSLIWNRFVADMGTEESGGPDADVLRHFEMSQLSSTTTTTTKPSSFCRYPGLAVRYG